MTGAALTVDPAAAPPAPPAAQEVFGDRLPVLRQYAALLAGPGVERGLLGPRETPRLWERHLLNCAGLSELVQEGEVVLDLGSGAGLPGLVLAAMRPDVTVVLCEPLLRRATFLREAVEVLGLSTVVRRARAEELAGTLLVDAVTSRAVAPLDKLAAWSLPLVREGGRLLALKGERADEEVAGLKGGLRGASGVRVVEVGSASLGTQARVVVAERTAVALGTGGAGPAKSALRGSTTARGRRRPS